jgi:hypothetical protein
MTLAYYFRQWRDDGTWKRVHARLVLSAVNHGSFWLDFRCCLLLNAFFANAIHHSQLT